MGKVYDGIDAHQREWIARQALFFVGTAPLAGDGHVNVSPKGPIGSLRVLDDHTVAYLDVIGSGAETIAHLRENGRIVVMLCAFQGPPRILRLHGRGEVVLPDDPAVPESRRSIVLVHVGRVADSCGYGVPLLRFEGLRPHAPAWAEKKLRVGGVQALADYERANNARSLDGLPALSPPGVDGRDAPPSTPPPPPRQPA
jgi:hypothetical protein